ncbi:MBL fold metallo-hydrolase [Stakelama saccharophila]|uniref:MBL fold metallo-hydrolase n=1 Tax=Stakelama saccharophila TaxID=3075605 RepID=A0ABZ0BBY0_9SPHN|nr:MBL fold metallo-hydrolase [Stakelama sp. W311]WNO53814.1 MBL fold metallo-hydrolase [Stakelama sp. W311]
MRPTLHPALVNGRFGDPAVFVRRLHTREALLFDIGDITALSARDVLRVDHVCVSHMHVDHFVGFDTLLRVNIGRTRTIRVVGPPGIAAAVGHKLAAYTWDLAERYDAELQFEVTEMAPPGRIGRTRFRLSRRFAAEPRDVLDMAGDRVLDAGDFTLHAAFVEHHGQSLAFAVSEPLHVNVWRNRVEARGFDTGQWLKPLKAAVRDGASDDRPIPLPDGGKATLGELRDLVSVEAGQKLGYVADMRDTPANRAAVAELCADADLLLIEAAFAANDAAQAQRRAHLTTRAAGEIARLAGARRVEPFHFSPRYGEREADMLAEVDRAFRGP